MVSLQARENSKCCLATLHIEYVSLDMPVECQYQPSGGWYEDQHMDQQILK